MFQEPVLLVFAIFVMHNIVIPMDEMHTFLSVPIAWEILTLKSNFFLTLMENVSWWSFTEVFYELGLFASNSHGEVMDKANADFPVAPTRKHKDQS